MIWLNKGLGVMSNLKVNFPVVCLSALVVFLTSCVAPNEVSQQNEPATPDNIVKTASIEVIDVDQASSVANGESKNQTQAKSEIYPGTGNFVNKKPATRAGASYGAGDDVSLIFQDAPLGEVATTILGDLMGMAYVLDERVTGNVSLKTGRPIPRNALVSVMEGILKANNAVLVDNNGIFHILPASENLTSLFLNLRDVLQYY